MGILSFHTTVILFIALAGGGEGHDSQKREKGGQGGRTVAITQSSNKHFLINAF